MTRMYKFVRKTWNPFVGCRFNCSYCWARRMAKRLKCEKCRHFIPHFHPERLNKIPKRGTIFVSDMGDISFCLEPDLMRIIRRIELVQERHPATFFFESKNPRVFYEKILMLGNELKPRQTIISTTMETNRANLIRVLSSAPPPIERYLSFKLINWPRKHVSIEPVMNFDADVMFRWITEIEPECVSVGYDNYNNRLPEPPLQKVLKLIELLEESGIEVERKTLREPWE